MPVVRFVLNRPTANKDWALEAQLVHRLTHPSEQAEREFEFVAVGGHKEGLADWGRVGEGFGLVRRIKNMKKFSQLKPHHAKNL